MYDIPNFDFSTNILQVRYYQALKIHWYKLRYTLFFTERVDILFKHPKIRNYEYYYNYMLIAINVFHKC